MYSTTPTYHLWPTKNASSPSSNIARTVIGPPTLWTHFLDTPCTPAIFYIDFPTHIRSIFNQYSTISTFSSLFQFLDVRAISHVDHTATAIYYQSHHSTLHIYSILPTFQPIISLEIEVFSLISHGHRLLL